MNNKLIALLERFDALPVRMRLLFTFVLIMIFGLLIDSLWISSNFQKSKQLKNEIANIEKSTNELINSQKELNANVLNQRNHPIHNQLKKVNSEILEMKQLLEDKTINLIKPEAMSSVLKDIIEGSKNLKIISMEKKPPEPLFDTKDEKQTVQMYRHFLELVLEGKFQDTQNFLVQLETMPQKVNFEGMLFEVEEYPTSKISLTVSTLSLNRKWIGG